MLREATVTLCGCCAVLFILTFPILPCALMMAGKNTALGPTTLTGGQGYKFHSAKITTRMMAGPTIFVTKRPEPGVLTSQA